MPTPDKERFVQEVISYVKFPFDRESIKSELEHHILDKMEHYTEQGMDEVQAEMTAVRDMGDARVIGTELNRQHNPVIGWLWKVTNVLFAISVVFSIIFTGLPLLFSLAPSVIYRSPKSIEPSDIIYRVDINERVRLDDRVITFTNIIYDKTGELYIFYEHYDSRLWLGGWDLWSIGEITDGSGNRYFNGSGSGRSGIKSKAVRSVRNFPDDAEVLIITFDHYNRYYRVEIPLPAGDHLD